MSKIIGQIIRTARHIKPVQGIYQIKNRLIKSKSLSFYKLRTSRDVQLLPLIQLPERKPSVSDDLTFTYLNLSKKFDGHIDWNFMDFGKLWNYNLQYVDFINQEDLPEHNRVFWLRELYCCLYLNTVKLEPYPVSLRIMNVIRFLSNNDSRVHSYQDIAEAAVAELYYLNENYEYHLLGNHLLENAFAMLMGSCFFRNEDWRCKAEKILKQQLHEQVLKDGGHFELSPMYHQIILFRVLEAISYLPNGDDLLPILKEKANLMLGWLKKATFKNGDIPQFNDSSDGIAFTTEQLMNIGCLLELESANITLGESGYRKFESENFELIIDVKGISPDYQPGHNHADHLSFILYINNRPFIVDPGTSTYNISERRHWERSSKAHNIVTVNNFDQSEVWGGFRVGRRPSVRVLKDSIDFVSASIEYNVKKSTIKQIRDFSVTENSIILKDSLNVRNGAIARFYLHPLVFILNRTNDMVAFDNGAKIYFKNISNLKIEEYDFANGFNKLLKSKVIEVHFMNSCESTIILS